MTWSWRLTRVAGIDLKVHATFLLLLLWVAHEHWQSGGGLPAVAAGIGFTLLLFACVALHELGHALAARRFGIPTRDITLLPVGGVARLEAIPRQPLQELAVAVAGPAVNVVIAAVLAALLAVTNAFQPVAELGIAAGSLVERLLIVNLALVVFNLLPAFPMDGGRVLRALLAMVVSYPTATRVAAWGGYAMAALFAVVAVTGVGSPVLLLIALFVGQGAAAEARQVRLQAAVDHLPVGQVMLTSFRLLQAQEPLRVAVDAVLAGSQLDLPVLAGDDVAGVLTRQDLLAAATAGDEDLPVGELVRRDWVVAGPEELLGAVLPRLEVAACRTVAVVSQGRLVGLVSVVATGEQAALQEALRAARRPTGG